MTFTTDIFFVNILLFIFGLFLLIKSSDWFVDAAVYIAHIFKVPEIVIGLTLVSIGTSLPEFATDVYASFCGNGAVAIGDSTGSNISNMCLVLGVGILLMKKIPVPKMVWKRDSFAMLAVFLIFIALAYFGVGITGTRTISRIDGAILFTLFIGCLIYLFTRKSDEAPKDDEEHQSFKNIYTALGFLILGLIGIFIGASTMVENVVWVAEKYQMNKALIAATIVAFGTSVPELAVTVTSSLKNKNSIALGNVLGSCVFNLLMVQGAAAMVNPLPVSNDMMFVVLPLMLFAGIAVSFFMRKNWSLVRAEGAVLILIYLGFITYNIIQLVELPQWLIHYLYQMI